MQPSPQIPAVLWLSPSASSREMLGRIACLERSIHDRNILMATAGHDLKQPLHIILRAIETLVPGSPTPSETMWFEAAIAQVTRLARGLSELATASLADDETEWTPCLVPFSVAALMDDLEVTWAIPASEKGLQLKFIYCSQIAVSDRRMVTTILNNLVGNAIKHTNFGRVVVGCRRDADALRFEVLDTGPGIAECHVDAIFRAGERAGSVKDGMGIGLSLVADLCTRLAATIELQTIPGRGARFSFALPRLS